VRYRAPSSAQREICMSCSNRLVVKYIQICRNDMKSLLLLQPPSLSAGFLRFSHGPSQVNGALMAITVSVICSGPSWTGLAAASTFEQLQPSLTHSLPFEMLDVLLCGHRCRLHKHGHQYSTSSTDKHMLQERVTALRGTSAQALYYACCSPDRSLDRCVTSSMQAQTEGTIE